MKHSLAGGLGCVLLLLLARQSIVVGQEPSRALTIWLIPVEQAAKDDGKIDLEKFNTEVSANGFVTVLNTSLPVYQEQLRAWNPEFASPNFPLINGQRRTLAALQQFARQNHVHINVRFVWWSQAFQELADIAKPVQPTDANVVAPDVAQVGSTWVGYFAKNNALAAQIPKTDNWDWRDTPYTPRASLRYTSDVRLIFYWKRMSYPAAVEPFLIDSTSWDSILESVANRKPEPKRPNPPLAMPVAYGLNLLHDLAPLIWSGGGTFIKNDKADLTSEAALSVPRKVMEAATQTDRDKGPRRIVAFPEMPHEEAVQHFFNGEYLAVIEPLSFIKRWRDRIAQDGLPTSFVDKEKSAAPPSNVHFWDYAGVAAPPRTFVGGSDLVVTSRARDKELSFDLARFLATDSDHTRTLAELGDLPAQRPQFGIDVLRVSLAEEPSDTSTKTANDGSTELADTLDRVLKNRGEQEYPPMAEWPIYIESREVLEAVQRVWRTIGGAGASETTLEATAAQAELLINQQIDRWTKWREALKRWWPLVAIGLTLGLLGIIAAVYRALRFREKALEEVHRVRGFCFSALRAVDAVHNNLKDNPYDHLEVKGRGKAMKALVLDYVLQGWRRGRDDDSWRNTPLDTIVWRSIILALESLHTACLFKTWENEGRPAAEEFLRTKKLMRASPRAEEGYPPFYFSVRCESADVPTPFMLEQALLCLLQNAIKASFDDQIGSYRAITITYDETLRLVSVLNDGQSLQAQNRTLWAALNEATGLGDFEKRIHELLLSRDDAPKPGVGLVEAYSIATQCYKGLLADKDQMKISIRLG